MTSDSEALGQIKVELLHSMKMQTRLGRNRDQRRHRRMGPHVFSGNQGASASKTRSALEGDAVF